jgi:hypothetical protein
VELHGHPEESGFWASEELNIFLGVSSFRNQDFEKGELGFLNGFHGRFQSKNFF